MDFKKFSKLIMIEQTLFALPFAYIGVLFASGGTIFTWLWVTIALCAARTAGMSFNRVIDAQIDGKNPRTKDRLIPKGEVNPHIIWLIALISSIVLISASYMLNMLCFYLSFLAILMLFAYSFFKRFSASSHYFLGLVEAAAPIGGYIAVTGTFSIIPFILGTAIMTWIAGLDIIYALQDMDFDIKENLRSIPVRTGKDNALKISALSYFLSIIGLLSAGIITNMGLSFWVCLISVSIIFIYQQKTARVKDISATAKKIFKVNAYISPLLFCGTLIDVYLF